MTEPVKTLRPGDTGDEVRELQRRLNVALALDPPLTIDGHFGPLTAEAVKAHQSSAIGPDGAPLAVDGIVGPVTWWSLSADDQDREQNSGAVQIGQPRCRLAGHVVVVAAEEIGHGEEGANNRGPWVELYGRGNTGPWCAWWVSYCVHEASKRLGLVPPFRYTGGARDIRRQLANAGLAFELADDDPRAGDIVTWWRGDPTGWKGHTGIVTDYADGVLWTLEGNRGGYPSRVRQFSYVLGRERRLLGFAKLCEET